MSSKSIILAGGDVTIGWLKRIKQDSSKSATASNGGWGLPLAVSFYLKDDAWELMPSNRLIVSTNASLNKFYLIKKRTLNEQLTVRFVA